LILASQGYVVRRYGGDREIWFTEKGRTRLLGLLAKHVEAHHS
jgi:hypothetical protein